MEQAVWALGCVNMTASMVFSMIAHHSKKLDEISKVSMHRAVNMHQVAALGFILLAYQGAPLLPLSMLTVGTLLFPGVIYFQTLT